MNVLNGDGVVAGKGANGPGGAVCSDEPTVEALFENINNVAFTEFKFIVMLRFKRIDCLESF